MGSTLRTAAGEHRQRMGYQAMGPWNYDKNEEVINRVLTQRVTTPTERLYADAAWRCTTFPVDQLPYARKGADAPAGAARPSGESLA